MRKKSNNIFYGGITVLIVICSFAYCWKFLLPKYVSQKAEIKTVEDELKSATNKLESIKKTRVTLETLKPITSQLFVAVPGDKDSPNLITELEATALKNKLIIPSIQISDGAKAAPTTTAATAPTTGGVVSISIAVNGSFDNLNAFITLLEKDLRFMNIKTLSITAGEDPSKISLTLQLEAYKRAAVVATPAPVAPVTAPATSTSTKTTGTE